MQNLQSVAQKMSELLTGAKRAALYVGWSQEARNGRVRNGTAPNIKLSITRSFFELQSPDFAWKYVWTVRTNYEKKLVRGVRGGFRGVKG